MKAWIKASSEFAGGAAVVAPLVARAGDRVNDGEACTGELGSWGPATQALARRALMNAPRVVITPSIRRRARAAW